MTCCSAEFLEAALDGKLSGPQETELHRHLECCDACCKTMEQLAGGLHFCEQVATCLTDDPLDETLPNRDEWSTVDFGVELLDPADDPSLLGRLGGYDIIEVIGRGGMGIVLKAFDPELKRYVAVKALSPHLSHSSLARKRFAREAQAAAAVVNPHVIAIHQVQPSGRLPFLVMPLLTGESLAGRLAHRGSLELNEILRIGMQSAAGLAAAHEQGLVHRDVKPANILLEKGVERAVLTDFGLARAADDVSMTRWGIISGTPQYMSPEQARGEPLDGRSDLFSLGCVLYEMATGVSPFRADTTIATLHRVVSDKPQAMASLNPELPVWFIKIVDRLLEKDPALRFDSAKEVSELLERCLAHTQQPTIVTLPVILERAPRRPAPRSSNTMARILMGSGIGLAILFAIVGAMGPMFALTPEQAKASSESNLHRLTSALMAYEQAYGHYPPSVIYGKDGQGGHPHSWRVEILPYLGYKSLYDQYHMDEPWDSAHNKTVLAQMPDVFRAPQAHRRSVNTSYFGVILEDAKQVLRPPALKQGLQSLTGPHKGTEGGGSPEKTALTDAARQRLVLATERVNQWKHLKAIGVATESEGIELQIEQERARIQVADAEGDRAAVREALDQIVANQEKLWNLAKELHKRGSIPVAEVDAAEIRYQEAMIHRASAQAEITKLQQPLERIVAAKARVLDRAKRLASAGVAPSLDVSKAEADWKLAEALYQAVAKMENALQTNVDPGPDAFHGADLNLVDAFMDSRGDKTRCGACHDSGQLDSWTSRATFWNLKDHFSSTNASGIVAPEEQTARRKAAEQWPAKSVSSEKQTLIRRMTLDLAGRLPTSDEVKAFLADDSADSVRKVVARLTEKPETLVQGTIADGIFVPYGSTMFSRPAGARQIEVVDGTTNTIALVESKRDIPWTQPVDIAWDSGRTDSTFGGWYDTGWYAGMADGRVKFIPRDTAATKIRALLTINGGESELAANSFDATVTVALDGAIVQPNGTVQFYVGLKDGGGSGDGQTSKGTPSEAKAVDVLDRSNERKNVVIKLKHAQAATVAKALEEFYESKRDKSRTGEREVVVVPDTTNNSLLLSATARYLKGCEEIIQKFDKAPTKDAKEEGSEGKPDPNTLQKF